MTLVTNMINLLLLILTWLIEFYLFLMALRFAMSLSSTCRQSQYYGQIRLLTDAFPNLIGRHLAKNGNGSEWLPWLVVILGAFFMRYFATWILASLG